MGESIESLVMRMRLDSAEADVALAAHMSKQRAASREYTAFWESALAKKDIAEKAEMDASLARLQANNAKKLASDQAYFAARKAMIEEQAAIAAIGKGSGAFGSIESKGASAAESAAIGAGVGAAAHKLGNASIFREIQVLMHEGIAGRWKQFISSFSRLLMFMGLTAETLVSSIPIIGTAIAGIFGNLKMRSSLAEQAGGYGTNEATTGTEGIIRKRLDKEIETLLKSGKISEDQARTFRNSMGSLAGIKSVQRDLAGIPGAFDDPEKQARIAREVAKITEQTNRENLVADREKMSHLERIRSLAKEHSDLLEKMNGLDMQSIEYAQNKLEQARLLNDMAKERAEIDKEQKELQKQYDSERSERFKVYGKAAVMDVEIPTIGDLAGAEFSQNLKNLYGHNSYIDWQRDRRGRWRRVRRESGPYDLSAGDGPFAGAAQQAELSRMQEMWDIIHGNAEFRYNKYTGENQLVGGQAFIDRQQRMAAENLLRGAGLDTPEMKAARMSEDIATINSNIAGILAAAAKDGIVLKDKE